MNTKNQELETIENVQFPRGFAKLTPDLTISDRLVYCDIVAYHWKNGYCFAKLATLSENAGISGRTMTDVIARLFSKGYIVKEYQFQKNDHTKQIESKIFPVKHLELFYKLKFRENWDHHLDIQKDKVKYAERRIKKYEREKAKQDEEYASRITFETLQKYGVNCLVSKEEEKETDDLFDNKVIQFKRA